MAIMILIRKLEKNGEGSEYLIEKLSGLELPLAGVAMIPYLPGQEILSNFEKHLREEGFCYLISKFELLQALNLISPDAAEEIRLKYPRFNYLPIKKDSCHVISHNSSDIIN